MDTDSGWWRILDANFNRCGEGLRVIEDWCRFVANWPLPSKTAKEMRHQLHELASGWPLSPRLTARDVPTDVGRSNKTASEGQRPDVVSFLQANFYRVQQSLRVLEETAKRLRLTSAFDLEHLRYQSYELQQSLILRIAAAERTNQELSLEVVRGSSGTENAIGVGVSEKSHEQRLQLLEQATLYVLTDSCGSLAAYQEHLRRLVELGVDVIQLRDKSFSDRELWEFSRWTAEYLAKSRVLFIVNDRPDVAAAAGADGVHVGQTELPVEAARKIVGCQRLVGVSTHNLPQVRTAQQTSANYLGLGPVFPSKTKGFADFAGLETLRQCHSALERPTFAIGGISTDNVAQVFATEIRRVAVQSALRPGNTSVDVVAALRGNRAESPSKPV
jgi:thiamine-phosphate pyrophosphorylase